MPVLEAAPRRQRARSPPTAVVGSQQGKKRVGGADLIREKGARKKRGRKKERTYFFLYQEKIFTPTSFFLHCNVSV
ncbi:MAG: hypothetical protein OER43_05735 [Gammaproteobacteria bacterium]|nr:hypothetical protein [Gammaproteobacteria bacterium]MDH3413760.1 hypothetical protein [Gammaproteobacteria bacterium]